MVMVFSGGLDKGTCTVDRTKEWMEVDISTPHGWRDGEDKIWRARELCAS